MLLKISLVHYLQLALRVHLHITPKPELGHQLGQAMRRLDMDFVHLPGHHVKVIVAEPEVLMIGAADVQVLDEFVSAQQ